MNVYSNEGLIIDGSSQTTTGFRIFSRNAGSYSTSSYTTVITFTASGSAPTNHKLSFYRFVGGGPMNASNAGLSAIHNAFYLNSSGYYVASANNYAFNIGDSFGATEDYNVATSRTVIFNWRAFSTSYLPANASFLLYATCSDWSYITVS